jgi:hypothetical protein
LPFRELERERRQFELVGAFHGGECDRQVLNREPCRVEHGHFVLTSASFGIAGQHRAELSDVFALEPARLERVNELPVVARLLGVTIRRSSRFGRRARRVALRFCRSPGSRNDEAATR